MWWCSNVYRRSLKEWVTRAVAHTGITRLVCGGGVFMNVKANKIISEIPGVEELFVFPSCGDESLSFGAVWSEYARHVDEETAVSRAPLTICIWVANLMTVRLNQLLKIVLGILIVNIVHTIILIKLLPKFSRLITLLQDFLVVWNGGLVLLETAQS